MSFLCHFFQILHVRAVDKSIALLKTIMATHSGKTISSGKVLVIIIEILLGRNDQKCPLFRFTSSFVQCPKSPTTYLKFKNSIWCEECFT